ncbi:MAG: antibiotic biosynthesis monooxygenase family protein [bacterium]
MVTFVVEHHIRDGHEADAQKIFDAATNHATRQPGLVFRQVLRSRDDPQKVISVICWESPEAFERQRRPRPQEVVDEEMRHFDTMTAELYDVVDRVNL